jgi:hypothetical protein
MTKESTVPPPRGRGTPFEDEFADLDAREALFTGALAQADRVSNLAAAMRRQVMLAGFDAMVLEEQAQGRAVRMDDAIVRAFLLHQATPPHRRRRRHHLAIPLGCRRHHPTRTPHPHPRRPTRRRRLPLLRIATVAGARWKSGVGPAV